MTLEALIEQCVRDAIYETGFRNPELAPVLAKVSYDIQRRSRERMTDQLAFNHMRDLMRKRKPK